MMVMLTAAVPSWRYLMKDTREEELLFRGKQIADAIQRYQKKNANAVPPSLDVLVKGKYLRKAYKDPMTKDGKWRFIRQGELTAAGQPATAPGGTRTRGPTSGPTTTTTTRPAGPRGGGVNRGPGGQSFPETSPLGRSVCPGDRSRGGPRSPGWLLAAARHRAVP